MNLHKTFDTGEIKLNYVELGSGDIPILYLHGGLANWQSCVAIMRFLEI